MDPQELEIIRKEISQAFQQIDFKQIVREVIEENKSKKIIPE